MYILMHHFFSLGVILHQNLDNTIDRPIYDASRLMKSAKNNYTAIEKKNIGNDLCCEKFIIYREIILFHF